VPLQVVKGDLTKQQVSAVVNPTSGQLQAWGGVSSQISRAAGPSFAQDCKTVLANLAAGGHLFQRAAVLSWPAAALGHGSMSFMLLYHITLVSVLYGHLVLLYKTCASL
jgi:hypothetical protein